jgi:hypothetical protein
VWGRAAVALAATLLLTACGGNKRETLPAVPQTVVISNACPGVGFLAEAAERVDFAEGAAQEQGPMMSALLRDAEIECEIEDRTIEADLEFVIEAAAGTGAPREVDLPYFVAVTRDQQVLARETFTARVRFDSDGRAEVEESVSEIDIPLGQQTSGAAFLVFVGFELSPAHVAYNRRRLPY